MVVLKKCFLKWPRGWYRWHILHLYRLLDLTWWREQFYLLWFHHWLSLLKYSTSKSYSDSKPKPYNVHRLCLFHVWLTGGLFPLAHSNPPILTSLLSLQTQYFLTKGSFELYPLSLNALLKKQYGSLTHFFHGWTQMSPPKGAFLCILFKRAILPFNYVILNPALTYYLLFLWSIYPHPIYLHIFGCFSKTRISAPRVRVE